MKYIFQYFALSDFVICKLESSNKNIIVMLFKGTYLHIYF